MEAELPFVDEHSTSIEAPRDVVWRALEEYVDRLIAANHGGLLMRLLGAHPPAGFEIAETEPGQRLVLIGRHRFSRYRLVFEVDPSREQAVLRASTYAVFPRARGRVYRVLVIGSRAHVLATRRMLAAVRRRSLADVA